jgi:hypothetical protein
VFAFYYGNVITVALKRCQRIFMYRVSEVLEFFKDYSGVDQQVLQEKQVIGRNVHDCIKAYYEDVPLFPQDREEGYFVSFLKWQEAHRLNPIHLEQRYHGTGYYASLNGQIDAVIPLNGVSTIVDWKCSYNPDFLCWPLQGYFYHRLLEQNKIVVNSHVLFLKLHKEGKMPQEFWFDVDQKEIGELAIAAWETFKAKKGLTKFKALKGKK